MISQKPYTERLMRFHLAKQGNTFIPASDSDKQKMDKIGQNEVVVASSVDQRSAGFHRKFFALMQFAWENKPEHMDAHFPVAQNVPDEFRGEITMRAGYFIEYTNFKGVKSYKPKSIAFDKMGQAEFEELYNACIDVIIKYMEIPDDVFKAELMEFIG